MNIRAGRERMKRENEEKRKKNIRAGRERLKRENEEKRKKTYPLRERE